MVLQSEAAEGLLDLRLRGRVGDAQNLVVVLQRNRSSGQFFDLVIHSPMETLGTGASLQIPSHRN